MPDELTAPVSARAAAPELTLSGWGGPNLPLHLAVPSSLGPDTPVVMVMHGVRRNGDDYRDAWLEIAEACSVLVVAPQFARESFPGADGYNLGGLAIAPAGSRAFDAIEPAFDHIRERFDLDAEGYAIFGHSAGSQVVHRYMMFTPDTRVTQAVAANAGWYTLPDDSASWPYGMEAAPADPLPAAELLKRPVTLLLGDADNDPDAPFLRQTPEANAQGPHRFARGHFMMERIERLADAEGVSPAWSIGVVPGVGHDNARMAGPALNYLLDAERLARPRCAALARGD